MLKESSAIVFIHILRLDEQFSLFAQLHFDQLACILHVGIGGEERDEVSFFAGQNKAADRGSHFGKSLLAHLIACGNGQMHHQQIFRRKGRKQIDAARIFRSTGQRLIEIHGRERCRKQHGGTALF